MRYDQWCMLWRDIAAMQQKTCLCPWIAAIKIKRTLKKTFAFEPVF